MGERRRCRERGGEGGRENVQWVSRVRYHGARAEVTKRKLRLATKSSAKMPR